MNILVGHSRKWNGSSAVHRHFHSFAVPKFTKYESDRAPRRGRARRVDGGLPPRGVVVVVLADRAWPVQARLGVRLPAGAARLGDPRLAAWRSAGGGAAAL